MEANESSPTFKIDAPLEMRGGVWANFARVSHSPHEFTIDFVRLDQTTLDPDEGIIEGVLVQRVNMSPLFVQQLIEALGDNLQKFAANIVPDGIIIREEDE